MSSTNRFSQFFSGLVGIGPGAGMGLLTVFCCLICALVGLSGYFVPVIRELEEGLSDYDQKQNAEAVMAD
jgi:hypothetical protein